MAIRAAGNRLFQPNGAGRLAIRFQKRARWVKAKVRQHIAGQPLQEMRQRQIRVLNLLRKEYVERLGEYVERLGDDAP